MEVSSKMYTKYRYDWCINLRSLKKGRTESTVIFPAEDPHGGWRFTLWSFENSETWTLFAEKERADEFPVNAQCRAWFARSFWPGKDIESFFEEKSFNSDRSRHKVMEFKGSFGTRWYTLCCEVDVDLVVKPKPPTKIPKSCYDGGFIGLYENPQFSDFQIRVGGEVLNVHKNILASKSPVFNAMLSNPMKESLESTFEVTDIEVEVVKEMLKYIYSGKTSLKDKAFEYEFTCNLLMAAHRFQLDRLVTICIATIEDNLNNQNVIDFIQRVISLDIGGVKNRTKAFIRDNADSVLKQEEWLTIAQKRPDLVMEICQFLAQPKQD